MKRIFLAYLFCKNHSIRGEDAERANAASDIWA